MQCVAYNSLNAALTQRACYTDLAVLPRPPQLTNLCDEPDAASCFISTTFTNTLQSTIRSSIEQQSFKPIADIPAYLIRGPDDCTALIGGTVCLTVTFGGYPKPIVTWMRAVSHFHFITFTFYEQLTFYI